MKAKLLFLATRPGFLGASIVSVLVGLMAGVVIGMHLREYLLVRLRGWEWHVLSDGKVMIVAHRDMTEEEAARPLRIGGGSG